MGQIVFDALQALEELENAGISREQAKAISLVVRRSHEVTDVATKTNIAEVKRDIADVRKDLSAEITNVRKDMEITRKDLQLEVSGIRAEQKLTRWMVRGRYFRYSFSGGKSVFDACTMTSIV